MKIEMTTMAGIAGIAGALMLAACQPTGGADNGEPRVSAEGNAALPSLPDGETPMPVEPDGGIGGPPSPTGNGPDLQPMVYAEFSEAIASGVGCSFHVGSGDPLFVSTLDDPEKGRAKGVVKIAGKLHIVTSTKAGGYGRILSGDILEGGRYAVNIGRTSAVGTPGEIETTNWPAVLTVTEIGVGDTSYTGRWNCGS